jgi:hypothetical protein
LMKVTKPNSRHAKKARPNIAMARFKSVTLVGREAGARGKERGEEFAIIHAVANESSGFSHNIIPKSKPRAVRFTKS